MIQRVQSIYLLLVTILMSFFLLSSYAFVTSANNQHLVFHSYSIGIKDNGSVEIVAKTLPLVILIALTGAISFFSIFLFHNRIMQMRICFILVILIFAQLILIYFYYTGTRSEFEAIHSSLRFPMIMPIICIVVIIMAYGGIKRDDTLVKSYNRMR